MPIINYFKREWNNKKGAYESTEPHYSPCNEMWDGLRLKKSRRAFDCSLCAKHRACGVRYLGNGWEKICVHCLEEGYLTKSKQVFQRIISMLDKTKKEIDDNKDAWMKEEVVNSL